jgi:hypothetical protein
MEDHPAVRHAAVEICAEGVLSYTAKFNPSKDSIPLPVGARFPGRVALNTALSNENESTDAVPTSAETVTAGAALLPLLWQLLHVTGQVARSTLPYSACVQYWASFEHGSPVPSNGAEISLADASLSTHAGWYDCDGISGM